MKVTYKAEGALNHHGVKESIELSVEIDDTQSYPDTLEFLRSRVLDNLDDATRNRHQQLKEEFAETAKEFVDLVEKIDSARKHWNVVSTFLKTQGLMTETAEFPKEALNDLYKSLPADGGGYPS
jgi:hypothetical protein